jgi:hypothetical protein
MLTLVVKARKDNLYLGVRVVEHSHLILLYGRCVKVTESDARLGCSRKRVKTLLRLRRLAFGTDSVVPFIVDVSSTPFGETILMVVVDC